MIDVSKIREITDHFGLDVDYSGTEQDDRFQALKQAIKENRIKIEEKRLCFVLEKDAKFFKKDKKEFNVAKFRRAYGSERRIVMNSGGKNVGDAVFKIIPRMCDITESSLDEALSFDVSVMEDIVNLFL